MKLSIAASKDAAIGTYIEMIEARVLKENRFKKISVIIPTYNRQDKIVRSIQSVLEQTYPVAEVIVADDCSTDCTEEMVKSVNDERVRYCRLPENRGAGGARNFGVSNAQFDIIAFHDSDDAWLPQKLEKQMTLWEREPEHGLVYSAYLMHLQYGIEHIVPDLAHVETLSGDIFGRLLVRNTVGAPTVLMHKHIFDEVGGFDQNMDSLEDWDFALKVAKRYSIGFVPEPLLEVTQMEGSVSSKKASFYNNRCYLLHKYRSDYLALGKLNEAVLNLLEIAQKDNIQEQVEKMIALYLSK